MKRSLILGLVLLWQSVGVAQECSKPWGAARVSATGDILVHKALFEAAISHSSRFQALWSDLIPTLKKADLTVGNLEGPVAPGVVAGGRLVSDVGFVYDDYVYSGTNFVFNYHPQLLTDLSRSGFDFLTTANNHSMDRHWRGADKTIDELERARLAFVGSRRSGSNEARGRIVRVGGFQVGMISCTESLNGMPDPYDQVLSCRNSEVRSLIKSMRSSTDAVFVFPHWGTEYKTRPNERQITLARQWIKDGALVVIGNHPHVLQTTEWVQRSDGRQALIIYSLGNFVAAQAAMEKRVSAVAHVDLARSGNGAEVSQFSYTPFMRPPQQLGLKRISSNSEEGRYVTRQLGSPRCR